MGLFDKLRGAVQGVNEVAQAPAQQAAVPTQQRPPSGETFFEDGESYPVPPGWDGLDIEGWFHRLETIRDRQAYIDQENLPSMSDEDGVLDPEEVLVIAEYGFQDGGHFEKYRHWGKTYWASTTGESPNDCEYRMGGIARERIMADKASAMQSGNGGTGQLDPVEDVSCEQWAQIYAAVASGGDVQALAAQAGMDSAKWERVNAEWMSRMEKDTTCTIATVYGNAFAGAGQGQHSAHAAHAATVGVAGDLGDEPVSYERFVEITVAQDAASQRGEDPIATLKGLGLTPLDWSNIGQFWSKKFQQEMEKYYQLNIEYTAKYEKKYGLGDGLTDDEREVQIVAELVKMSQAGQGGEMLAYLKQRQPDDADDNDVMDGWLDRACDALAEQGDKNAAQQVLQVRYPLQDDEDDPVNEWISSQMSILF